MARKAYRVRVTEKDNHQQEKIIKLRQLQYSVVLVFVVLIIGILVTYAMYKKIVNKNKNSINVGTLEVVYKSDISNLELLDSYPISDELGKKKKPYIFTITNNGNYDVSYRVRLIDDYAVIAKDKCQKRVLSNSNIKVSVNNKQPFILKNKELNNYVISENILSKNEKKEYRVKIWIDDSTKDDVLNKHYHGKIVVNTVSIDTRKSK